MTFVALVAVAAVIVAAIAFMSASAKAKQLAQVQAQLAAFQKEAGAQQKAQADLRSELTQVKAQLREEKDAIKALKKKAFDAKKPAPPEPAIPNEMAEQVRELDKQWRLQAEQLARAENVLREAQAEAQTLREKLDRAQASTSEIAALRAQLDAEKQRVGAEAKALTDMRRKVEWYRRIHLVQQKEMEVAKDKEAHVRQRLLEVCGELVRVQKISPERQAEIDRLKREEAAYQSESTDLH